jgi:hypothetical protein
MNGKRVKFVVYIGTVDAESDFFVFENILYSGFVLQDFGAVTDGSPDPLDCFFSHPETLRRIGELVINPLPVLTSLYEPGLFEDGEMLRRRGWGKIEKGGDFAYAKTMSPQCH